MELLVFDGVEAQPGFGGRIGNGYGWLGWEELCLGGLLVEF